MGRGSWEGLSVVRALEEVKERTVTSEGRVLGRKKGESKSPEVRRLKGHRQDQ